VVEATEERDEETDATVVKQKDLSGKSKKHAFLCATSINNNTDDFFPILLSFCHPVDPLLSGKRNV
jgi:hypothetical protein